MQYNRVERNGHIKALTVCSTGFFSTNAAKAAVMFLSSKHFTTSFSFSTEMKTERLFESQTQELHIADARPRQTLRPREKQSGDCTRVPRDEMSSAVRRLQLRVNACRRNNVSDVSTSESILGPKTCTSICIGRNRGQNGRTSYRRLFATSGAVRDPPRPPCSSRATLHPGQPRLLEGGVSATDPYHSSKEGRWCGSFDVNRFHTWGG